MIALDKAVLLGECFLINKFLKGLGPEYDIFITATSLTNSLLPERDEDGTITRDPVTYRQIVKLAEHEELTLKQINATSPAGEAQHALLTQQKKQRGKN